VKTLDNFRIETKAGVSYDMAADFNVLVRSFSVSSPRPDIETEKVSGQHGDVRYGKTWGNRRITAVCSIFAVDSYDISLLRSEVFKALMNVDEFYVICDADPGKRWLVEVGNEWAPERAGTYGEFTLEFVSHKPFAESIGTTLDPRTFEAELWQVGQGLTVDASDYTQMTTAFSIYNAGDTAIDPRQMPLKITFKGASTNVKITNSTTGDAWQYTGTTTASDTVLLDGIRATKNGLTIFRDSNRKLITLAPGWNEFAISGASGAVTISFDFRFYTL
jgi:phage-related protein